MAKRVKSREQLIPVENWKHADVLVKRMGDLQQQIDGAQAAAKEKANKAKAELADKVEGPNAEIKRITKSLESFCAARKKEFGDRRSRKLNFGIVGWRRSTSISCKKTTADRIREVFSKAKAATLLHVKTTPDKEALAKLDDEQLVAVDAKRRVKNEFYVEPGQTEAADYGESD